MKYCTKCGAQLPDESVFCGSCGCKCEPLVIETKDEVVNIVITDEPPTEQQSAAAKPVQPAKPTKTENKEEKPNKPVWKGFLGFLLPIVLVILLIGLIGLIRGNKGGDAVDYRPNQKVEQVK